MDPAKTVIASPLKKNITWSDPPENSDGPASGKVQKDTPRITVSPKTANAPASGPQVSPSFIGKLFSYFRANTTVPDDDLSLKRPVFTEDTTLNELNTLSIAELTERLENMSKTVYNDTKITWTRPDFKSIRAIPRGPLLLPSSLNPHSGEFAQKDSKGQAKELAAEIHLLQAKACWLSRDYKSMAIFTKKALDASEGVSFAPYTAKVCFYIAISYIAMKDFQNGLLFLEVAQECKGVYREGELLDWVRKESEIYQTRVNSQSSPTASKSKSKSAKSKGKSSIYDPAHRRQTSSSTAKLERRVSAQWWHEDVPGQGTSLTTSPGQAQFSAGSSSRARSISLSLSDVPSNSKSSSFSGNLETLGAELGLDLGNLIGELDDGKGDYEEEEEDGEEGEE